MKLSCKHVSIKLSESMDNNLSVTEHFFIKIHLLMCKSCQQLAKQMSLLTRSTSKNSDLHEPLSNDARQRILDKIKAKLN